MDEKLMEISDENLKSKPRTPSGNEISQKVSDVRTLFSPENLEKIEENLENETFLKEDVGQNSQDEMMLANKSCLPNHENSVQREATDREGGLKAKQTNDNHDQSASLNIPFKVPHLGSANASQNKKRKKRNKMKKKIKDNESVNETSDSSDVDDGFVTPIEGQSPRPQRVQSKRTKKGTQYTVIDAFKNQSAKLAAADITSQSGEEGEPVALSESHLNHKSDYDGCEVCFSNVPESH